MDRQQLQFSLEIRFNKAIPLVRDQQLHPVIKNLPSGKHKVALDGKVLHTLNQRIEFLLLVFVNKTGAVDEDHRGRVHGGASTFHVQVNGGAFFRCWRPGVGFDKGLEEHEGLAKVCGVVELALWVLLVQHEEGVWVSVVERDFRGCKIHIVTLDSATVIAAGEDRFVALVSEDDLEGDDCIVVLIAIVCVNCQIMIVIRVSF